MLPSRWSHLARHGLLGTTLLTIASSSAVAETCDYQEDSSVGVVLGIDIAPSPRLIGGLEARRCVGDRTEVFIRLELGRGGRLIAGARARPFETDNGESDREKIGLEAGIAIESDAKLGAHLAATYGYHFAYLAAQGLFPLDGHPRPKRASLLFGVSPWTLGGDNRVSEGRPLIHDGQLLRPAITSMPVARDAEDRAVRDHFASSAQLELSSVWTFLRLAAELAAVGAPAGLIARALDAADDEVRHAGMCAHAAGGVELAPLPINAAKPRFTARTPHTLATLAVEAWLEGCLNETAAAEEARLAAAEATLNQSMLHAIALDEHGHAELSWAVLAWLFEVAPAIARTAIANAPGHLPVASSVAADPALARRGVASPELSRAARADAELHARDRLRVLAA